MVWDVERMDEYRVARRVLMAEVSGGRVRGRPRLGWMNGMKVALGNRGMMVEAHMERGGMPLHAVGINCKRTQLLKIMAQVSSIWTTGCIMTTVCMCVCYLT